MKELKEFNVVQDKESALLVDEQVKQTTILDSMVEGLYTVDDKLRLTSFNEAAERVTGWKEQEIVGRACTKFFNCGLCDNGCPLITTLQQGKPVIDYKLEMCNREGKRVPVRMNSMLMRNSNGEALGVVASFRYYPIQQYVSEKMIAHYTDFYGLVGGNNHMLELYARIQDIADSKATVLITGESGTGKELVAHAIQRLSSRAKKTFVTVNCGAIPETLVESELFGHVKGAFTGSYTDHMGWFEKANAGTIFLDEIGELTSMAQLRLLRVIDKGELQKVGSSTTIEIDTRIIAATNCNLREMVQKGKFRLDLYYRLNVIPITLPPLRERRDDLPRLIEHFMEKYRHVTRKPIIKISEEARKILIAYDYPGNVRELENFIEYAFMCCKDNIITVNHLPQSLPIDKSDERNHIIQILIQCHWNREKGAQKLGIGRTTLWRKMRALGIN